MAFEGAIEDRLAIRERIESYGDAVFRRDEKDWAANWAEDSVWKLGATEVKGKANIVNLWRNAMASYSHVAFFGTPGAIEVRGYSASVRVYTLEFLVETNGKARRIEGHYDDRLVKRSGCWLFKSRAYTILRDT